MKKYFIIFICSLMIISMFPVVGTAKEDKEPVRCTLLMEASTGTVLSESNGYQRVPQGTMTKLMTILLAAEEISEGRLSSDTVITAGAESESRKGAVVWIKAGESITVDELLKAVIIGNANDASVVIAEEIGRDEQGFVDMMLSLIHI